jgi:hypothetical protein
MARRASRLRKIRELPADITRVSREQHRAFRTRNFASGEKHSRESEHHGLIHVQNLDCTLSGKISAVKPRMRPMLKAALKEHGAIASAII